MGEKMVVVGPLKDGELKYFLGQLVDLGVEFEVKDAPIPSVGGPQIDKTETNSERPRLRRSRRSGFPEACKYALIRAMQMKPDRIWPLNQIRDHVKKISGHGESSVGTELSKGCTHGSIERVSPSHYRLTEKGIPLTPEQIWK